MSYFVKQSTSSSGAGSLATYITLQSDNDTGTWTTGHNSTFLTAGSFAGTWAKSNTTSPLNGKSSYTLTQAAGSQYDWVCSKSYPVPLRSRGVTNRCKLVYTYNGNDNDIKAVIYDATTADPNKVILSSQTAYIKTSSIGKQFEILFDVPATCANLRVGFHVMVANSGKVLKFDDIQVSDEAFGVANLVTQESVTYTGFASKDSTTVKFLNKDVMSNNSILIEVTNNTYTKYKLLKKAQVTVVYSVTYASARSDTAIYVYNSDGSFNRPVEGFYTQSGSTGGANQAVFTGVVDAGQYFVAVESVATPTNSTATSFSITATAVSENIIQSWQPSDCIGEIKYLPQNIAPQGFLPANGSIIGLSSGSHQGNTYYDLYNVLWNVAQTTAGEPYVISSAKGASASADWSAGKTIKIDESGLFTRAYLSGTSGAVGAKQNSSMLWHYHPLSFDTGTISFSATSAGSSTDRLARGGATSAGTLLATGPTLIGGAPADANDSETRPTNVAKYAFIRYATAQPTLLALPNGVETDYYLEAAGNGGQTITTSQDIPFAMTSQSNLAWDGTGFTAPVNGEYEVSGSVYFTTSAQRWFTLFVDSVETRLVREIFTSDAHVFSGKIKLNAGQRLSLRARNNAGILSNNTINHHISITRLNGKIDKTFVGNVSPIAPTIQKFTSGSGTYTLPTTNGFKPTYIRVRMVGGGGNGGNGLASQTASGGGAGGYLEKIINNPLSTYSYAVGAALANSTFGSLTAAGGSSGASSAGGSVGGVGGTATGGDLNITGAFGGASFGVSGSLFLAGHGASSPFGGGGHTGGTGVGVGGGGTQNTGSGGGGGSNGGSGGAGGSGYIEVTEYYF